MVDLTVAVTAYFGEGHPQFPIFTVETVGVKVLNTARCVSSVVNCILVKMNVPCVIDSQSLIGRPRI